MRLIGTFTVVAAPLGNPHTSPFAQAPISEPEVLMKMANYYDAEVAAAVRDLLTLMEPILIVVMALIVGFIVAGLMLPTFQMSSLVG